MFDRGDCGGGTTGQIDSSRLAELLTKCEASGSEKSKLEISKLLLLPSTSLGRSIAIAEREREKETNS